MRQISHFINGAAVAGEDGTPVFDPSAGVQTGVAAVATDEVVEAAVAAARGAFAGWSRTGLQQRAGMMIELGQALRRARDELIQLVVSELGKTPSDAGAEVERAIEVLGQAASIGTWYGASFSPGVSRGVDAYEVRYPIGVVAAVSPFNFPVLIPVVQAAMAIASGNTVVLKPSDRDPGATVRIAELFAAAGLPDGVFNVVLGGKAIVDQLIAHPDIAGISFVGSTPVAQAIRVAGVAKNKRVQAFGGGKNHMVVLPDSDLDMAADAAVSAAYGAAGQRCMAVSVVVAVGDIADSLVAKIAERVRGLRTGPANEAGSDVGPVITSESRDRIARYLEGAKMQGGELVAGGDLAEARDGWYVAPALIDHVKPGMAVHSDELFGPVLSVVRVGSYDEAASIIANHPLGNGAAIFTRDGGAARQFIDETEAGQIGVNVPIPFPVFFHSFGGWKDSAFTETKLFGPGAIAFHTRTKTVTSRWPDPAGSRIDLGFPRAN
ncbi:CoA-acylating methylmalonate-semialdehyde dehydrogenase [Trinickia terrae]|uniref:methylmalonate-semialdehyde dehydrogenase (CoA acylating) n=2 Tax=Trinickia terrae TaxID=2571161 RepID=A0A4V5PGY3_9BURK|nr:CoA-acylating methylmalonate-semialdehyde dehydrogenase [Trinickia terrae]